VGVHRNAPFGVAEGGIAHRDVVALADGSPVSVVALIRLDATDTLDGLIQDEPAA
jgi:hypothetical protein